MTTPVSGNRWEPSAGPTPEETDPRASTRRRPRVPRPRLWLVAVAAAFFLVGGVGGFLVAHATAGHGDSTGQVAPANDHGPRTGAGADETHGLPPGTLYDPDSDDDGTGHNPFGRGDE